MMKISFSFFLMFFLLLLGGTSYPAVSQYFDSEGNMSLSEPRITVDDPTAKNPRVSLPEGIELQKDIRYEYYPVFGKTFSEIVSSSEENGPYDRDKKRRFPSRLTWSLGWSYQFDYSYALDEESNKAHITLEFTDIDMRYNLSIILPTLIDDTALNPAEIKLWKNYFNRLLEQENDRIRIIRDSDQKNTVISSIKDMTYLIFDYKSDADTERTVELFIRDETSKIGTEWVRKIRERLDEHDRKAESVKKGSGE